MKIYMKDVRKFYTTYIMPVVLFITIILLFLSILFRFVVIIKILLL
ncbi:hypothetical protein KBD68_02060 [Candidatus Woesebacteria bacterium]|nr:hypothetical protein [Candidatus Woesebacteria bacterium]